MGKLKAWWKRFVTRPLAHTMAEVSWFGYVLSAILIAAVVNVVTSILISLAGWLAAVIVLAIALLGTLVYANLHSEQIKRRLEIGQRHIGRPQPQQRRGLILLFSNLDTSKKAIEYHIGRLEHVWAVVTPAMWNSATELRQFIEDRGVAWHQLDLSDEYDADACYRLVQSVFELETQRLHIGHDEIIADITGGTKVMTAGMVLACADMERASLELVPAVRAGTEEIGPLLPVEVALHR